MTELELKAKFGQKVLKVYAAIKTIEKNGRNQHFNYSFASDPEVLDKVRAELIKAGLVILPSMTDVAQFPNGAKTKALADIYRTRVTIAYEILDTETGYSKEVQWTGEAVEGEDKGINKAGTSATKYQLLKLFLIPTGLDPDAEIGDGNAVTPKSAAQPKPATAPKPAAAPKPAEPKPAAPKEYTAKPTGLTYKAFGEKFGLPQDHTWDEERSENQLKMAHQKVKARGLTADESKALRHLLCELAKAKPETWDSKGARSIQIDFLMGSSDRALSEAKAEIDKRRGQETLPE